MLRGLISRVNTGLSTMWFSLTVLDSLDPSAGPSRGWFQNLVPSFDVRWSTHHSYLGQRSISQSKYSIPSNPRQKEILWLKYGGDVDEKRTVEAFGDGDHILPNEAGPAPLRVLHSDIKTLGAVCAGPGEREEAWCPVLHPPSAVLTTWWSRPPRQPL